MTAPNQVVPVSRIRGGMLKFALIGLAVIAAGAVLTWIFTCPCGPVPGGYLFGKPGCTVPDTDQRHTAPRHQPQLHGYTPGQPLPQLFTL
jgi:hypothetical protein